MDSPVCAGKTDSNPRSPLRRTTFWGFFACGRQDLNALEATRELAAVLLFSEYSRQTLRLRLDRGQAINRATDGSFDPNDVIEIVHRRPLCKKRRAKMNGLNRYTRIIAAPATVIASQMTALKRACAGSTGSKHTLCRRNSKWSPASGRPAGSHFSSLPGVPNGKSQDAADPNQSRRQQSTVPTTPKLPFCGGAAICLDLVACA